MNKQTRALLIQSILEKSFPNPKVPLNYKDPYTLLIATLLSAQTTDLITNKITKPLFEIANSPETMIAISQKELEDIIKPIGIYKTKAKAILNLSKNLLAFHQGKVPSTFKDLEKLPGVGHKTASVVMAYAFNKPSFPVDRHIHRVAKRWHLSSGKDVKTTERDLKKRFPKNSWKKLHLQMLLFARKYCKAQNHEKTLCPICSKAVPCAQK